MKLLFKGSKETRILIIEKEKYTYIKMGNSKELWEVLEKINFKKARMKELERKKIELFAKGYKSETLFTYKEIGYLENLAEKETSLHL